jgi:hypothetical protein
MAARQRQDLTAFCRFPDRSHLSLERPDCVAGHAGLELRNVVAKDLFLLRVWSASIIPCPNVVELSNNIIQKGLAFGRDWSGTVVNPSACALRDPAPPAAWPRWGFGGAA